MLIHAGLRLLLVGCALFAGLGRLWRRLVGVRRIEGKCRILLTGTFYSTNWIAAHLRPLAASRLCDELLVVSTCVLPPLENVRAIYPPGWLRASIGDVPARLASFAWTAVRCRPHVVGGFHLLMNGMFSALLAPWVRARAWNFCVSGPHEVIDGGIWAENRLFGKLETPDRVVERQLVSCVRNFDLVIAMGTRAPAYFRERGVNTPFEVIPGGIDATNLTPATEAKMFDLVLVGRLAQVKRIDVFLRALALAREQIPTVKAAIVGDGELRESLVALTRELGLTDCVQFTGHQSDVASWLRRSRVFVLSSDSEGLALSLIEAMMCGLPAIVSDVGDLRDLVSDGVNGYVVPRRDPGALAQRIVALLSDSERLAQLGRAARTAALQYDVPAAARKWDAVLDKLSAHAPAHV